MEIFFNLVFKYKIFWGWEGLSPKISQNVQS